jgi:hypothetical protein
MLAIAVSVGGLVLAVAGLARAPGSLGGAPSRTLLHVPEPLVVFIYLSAALAITVLLGLLLPGRRRRRKADEDFELVYEPPKISPLAQAALWATLALPVAVAVYAVWLGSPWLERVLGPGATPGLLRGRGVGPIPMPPSRGAPGPGEAVPFLTWAAAGLALCAGLALAGAGLWILFGDRLAWWWAGPLPEPGRDELVAIVEESLEDLTREPDARRAIILCYRRFELALDRIKAGRAPWQTPTEFMRQVLARLSLPVGPVWQLTSLFEISRFSAQPLGATDRDAASRALTEIRNALERRFSDALES